MKITIKEFGTVNHVPFDEICIEKVGEFKYSFSDLGARINSWQVPNADGEFEHIVLGFDDAQHAFEGATYYYGATIGRVAGRITGGAFHLNNKKYTLPKNNNENHLHGGNNSFDLQKWDYSIVESSDRVSITFKWMDKAGTNFSLSRMFVLELLMQEHLRNAMDD